MKRSDLLVRVLIWPRSLLLADPRDTVRCCKRIEDCQEIAASVDLDDSTILRLAQRFSEFESTFARMSQEMSDLQAQCQPKGIQPRRPRKARHSQLWVLYTIITRCTQLIATFVVIINVKYQGTPTCAIAAPRSQRNSARTKSSCANSFHIIFNFRKPTPNYFQGP